jgi:hypothetical protein
MEDQEVFSGQDFGDLKKEVEELLHISRKSLLPSNLSKLEIVLALVKERLDCCGHCNGPTYENGVCTDHFTEY